MKGWQSKLPPPYLRSVWLDQSRVADATLYPFCLPFLSNGFQLDFAQAITIIIGENGTGKSTLLEGIAALAGYDEAGGGKGYRPVDHSRAFEGWEEGSRARCAPLGCRKSPVAGSFARKVSFRSRAISMRRPLMSAPPRRISFRIRTAKAGAKASLSLTNLNRRCRPPARSSS
jgi:predicted ATPase